MRWFQKLVRKWTKWAWINEIECCGGIAHLRELHAKPGSMEVFVETEPALSLCIAQAFATLVQKSENYTEMKFDVRPSNGEWISVTVQKGTGKTPHELRSSAEYERDAFKRDIAELRKEQGVKTSPYGVVTTEEADESGKQIWEALNPK